MPRKLKAENPGAEVLAPIPADILDQIVRDGPLTAEEVETAARRFKKALIERALGAELTHHLGYPPGAAKPDLVTNHRNGTSGKTVLTDDGPVAIEVPRDREGTFEPQLIGKHARRFTGFDEKVIALYAPRPDRPRDSGFSEGDVRGRCLAGFDQRRDRCGGGRSDRLAKPTARAAVPSRLLFRRPRGRMPRAYGRRRPCGRRERAHRGLGKPHRTRFPTAPTRIIVCQESEKKDRSRFTHRIPDTPFGNTNDEDSTITVVVPFTNHARDATQ